MYKEYFKLGLRPDSILSVSEWADKYRVLSQTASSEPGRFRTSRTPYLKEIMDCLSSTSDVERVVFMKGAQIGGTEAGNNWLGYIIDQAPGATLVVQPTVEMGKRWSKGRLAPLIEDSPRLRDKVKSARSRDSGNTVQSKEFPGGIIVITGANSAVGLRSMPVRYLFLDEVDAYPLDADSEGDPVSLAIQRTATFTRRKILLVSTPTIKGISRIEKEFEESDQRYFFVPCPYCGGFQALHWENLRYDSEFNTHYECEFCKKEIYNYQKTEIMSKGEWRSTNKASNGKIAGFHLSSLYSPVGWMDWETCARNYEAAKDDDQRLKAWVNTTLGLPWEDKGECPDWGVLFDRREHYKIGVVPKGGLVLTAGVDVQNDRLEIEIVAWGRNKESWSVDYRVIDGSPTTQDTWDKLSKILEETFESEDKVDRRISMMAIDTGFSTQDVYTWVRNNSVHNVMAVKGSAASLVPVNSPNKVDVNIRGKKIKGGVRLWTLGVSLIKSEIYGWLKHTANEDGSFPRGYMHIPEYPTEYFKQLTSEQLVTRVVKGYPKREWQKTRERNEALDCRVYARAAAIALGIDRWSNRRWESLENQIPEEVVKSNDQEEPRYKRRIIRSGWM